MPGCQLGVLAPDNLLLALRYRLLPPGCWLPRLWVIKKPELLFAGSKIAPIFNKNVNGKDATGRHVVYACLRKGIGKICYTGIVRE